VPIAAGGSPPLGATPDDSGTTFAVWSSGEVVDLCLYDDAGHESRVRLTDSHGVWHGHVPGVGHGQRYGYRVHGPWDPWHGHRFNPAKLLVDPYARAIDGVLRVDDSVVDHSAADQTDLDAADSAPFVPRSVVVDARFDWTGDRAPAVPWSDTVIYELHVRGFTMRHPDVPQALRGTYAGLAHPAVLEHLTSLGVTTVELLPVHHHVPELNLLRQGLTNYWGYNTLGFFAPHAGYSSAGDRGGQVREFAGMVRAMHDAGLEVVLDVVYNHTAEGGVGGPTLSWRGLDNAGSYRLRHGRDYEDFTGCGDTLDLRHPRVLALVTDSLRYWAQEMHVDGFRFDLAPTLARGSDAFESAGTFLSVVGQDPVLSRLKLIAEPWDIGPGGYQLGRFPAPWAEWNDRFRDTVRESWLADNAARGSAGGGAHHDPAGKQGSGMRDLAYRLTGSSDVFDGADRGPLSSVNFVTAHDGFTLHDLVTYERKRNEANGEDNRDGSGHNRGWNCGAEGPTSDPSVLQLRRQMIRNLMTTLVTATGVPMLTAGDETARTQLGNNNAYCLDDETTWVDWDWMKEPSGQQADLLAWTRALLSLRRTHPALGQEHDDGRKDLAWFSADGLEMTDAGWFDHDRRVIGGYVAHPLPGGESLLMLANTGPDETSFVLPNGHWATAYSCLLDTTDEQPHAAAGNEPAGGRVRLAPYSIRIFATRP
jgi:isoamylase